MTIVNFEAIVIKKNNNTFHSSLENCSINKLKINEVLVKVAYSSLNFKDMMVFEGNPGLVRKYPHTPGIDVVGIVEKSNSKNFKVGDKVIVIARPFGINMNGGLAEYTKVPDHWLEKLPKGLSMKEAAIFGTAGFTSGLCILKYKKIFKKNKFNNEKVLITGATGGVGLTSIYLFKKSGFQVHALTSKKSAYNILKKLRVNEVFFFDDYIKNFKFPLLKKNYSCILDNLGGETLSISSSQLNDNGVLFIIGIITSNRSNISLLPFVLRGINFFGINAENSNELERKKVWSEIIKLKDKTLPKELYNSFPLSEVPNLISKKRKNNKTGRIIIKIGNFDK